MSGGRVTRRSLAARENAGSALMAALAVGGAMILGGGGSPAPLAEMAVQLLLALILCIWLILFPPAPPAQLRHCLLLGGLLLLVPLVQLVPLPPALWHGLPGRELQRASLGLVGEDESWRPLSLAPMRTLNALLVLVPPAIVILLTGTLGSAGRSMVVGMVAGVAFMAVIVGAMQTAGGETNPLRFYVPDAGYLNGFQANHNSAADILLIGMVAFAVAAQDWCERRRPPPSDRLRGVILLTGCGVLSIGVFLTASRAGTMLLPVAWAAVWLVTSPGRRPAMRRIAIGVAGLVAVIGAGLLLLRGNAVLAGVLSRYTFGSELRLEIWADSLQAARAYAPVGAGMGAFSPVFLAAERLEAVRPSLPNRAHNDFLEFAIEAGVLGFAVLAILAVLLSRMAWRQLQDCSPCTRRQVIFALAVFTIIALHSQVDYPLRSISLACIAAASAGLLVPVARGPRGADVPVTI